MTAAFSPMPSGRRGPGGGDRNRTNLLRAFDEAQFGPARTLNLRESLPTVEVAIRRAEGWLREKQVRGDREVLVITGKGNNSFGGRSPVREGVVASFPLLKRKGVVAQWREHSPGSFEVVLAPLSALFDAPQRKRDPAKKKSVAHGPVLAGLDQAALERLRYLAMLSLEQLGVTDIEALVESEMVSKFSHLAASGVDDGADLGLAIEAAIAELDG